MAKRGRHQYVRDATDDNAEIVSRSQRKRDSAALQAKGEELALLPEPVTLSDVKEPPEKPPELIAGVLRRGQDGALRWIHSVHAPRPLDDVRPMASADWYV